MKTRSWISLHELNQLTQRCLAIMSLMDKLAGPLPKENPENDNDKQHAARCSRSDIDRVNAQDQTGLPDGTSGR